MASKKKSNTRAAPASAKRPPTKRPTALLVAVGAALVAAGAWALYAKPWQHAGPNADAKSTQPAPVFVSWFGWQPPLFDARLRAFHCVDICFWFYNTDLMLSHTGGGARPRKLAAQMSDYLVQFMRTGDPNGGNRTRWPKYTTANGETMVLDDVCEAKNDPDREARKALPAV